LEAASSRLHARQVSAEALYPVTAASPAIPDCTEARQATSAEENRWKQAVLWANWCNDV